jgi:hypothetical protein
MKKRFAFGFLMLALIVLLSGMIQSNNAVEKSTPVYALDNSPPAIQPIFITVIPQNETVTWLCTSMPGVQFSGSYMNSYAIVYEDMPGMKCNIYYTIQNKDLKTHISSGNRSQMVKYPLDVYGLRKS